MQSMDEYKQEKKFKRCLEKLQLNHVLDAIVRAKTIMQINGIFCMNIKDIVIMKKIHRLMFGWQ